MLTSLFSIFDPSLTLFSFSFLSFLFFILFLGGSLWALSSWGFFLLKGLRSLCLEVDYSMVNPKKGVYACISSVFFLLFSYNFFSLFPHIFSFTSHFMYTFPISFGFWLSIVFFIWFYYLLSFLNHLIPSGTPVMLMSFMVLVELVSNLIRPLALTFRLTANMMAGHLLMSIIGNYLIGCSLFLVFLGSLVQMFLVFMELGVSLIQAYVFSVLLILYKGEVSH